MQRSFDAMSSSPLDLGKMMNMPGVQFLNLSDLEGMQPEGKKRNQRNFRSWILKIFLHRIRSRPDWMSMW
jgi:hypothetical protein